MHAYAEGKWTMKQILGHMIDTERDFRLPGLCLFARNNMNCRVLTRMFI